MGGCTGALTAACGGCMKWNIYMHVLVFKCSVSASAAGGHSIIRNLSDIDNKVFRYDVDQMFTVTFTHLDEQ